MKRMVTMCAFVGSIVGGVSVSAITGDQPEFHQLAEDVYAYIGKLNDSNAMAIVTTEGSSSWTPATTRRTRAN